MQHDGSPCGEPPVPVLDRADFRPERWVHSVAGAAGIVGLADHIERALLYFVVDATQILTDDPDGEELYPAKEEDDHHGGGPAADLEAAGELLDDEHHGKDETGKRDDQPKPGRQPERRLGK